tara:strand:- start:325 stop:741 length:417 start_codon:yes stop_codon:yes gene_type:complete
MPFKMDVGDYFARTSGLGEDKSPLSVVASPTAGMFGASRQYGKTIGKPVDFGAMDDFSMDSAGTGSILGSLGAQQDAEYGAASSALGAIGDARAAEILAEARNAASRRQARASDSASTKGMIGSIVGGVGAAAVGALI